jgi:hypothetical protein
MLHHQMFVFIQHKFVEILRADIVVVSDGLGDPIRHFVIPA